MLFLSKTNDPILFSAYQYFSNRYEKCYYNMDCDASLIITNYYINKPNKKIIFYVTEPPDDHDIATRRIMINWLKECDVICSSLMLCKNFYDKFRIKSVVQYPYIPEQQINPINIVYCRDFIGIDEIRNELSNENFIELNDANDIINAKIYLASSSLLGVCYANAYGIPVVMQHNPNLQEFLTSGDVVVERTMLNNKKIQIVKKALKEYSTLKIRKNKFAQMPVMDDKIKQALDKKPICREQIPQSQTLDRVRARTRIVDIPPLTNQTIYISGGVVGISGYDNLVFEIIKGLNSFGLDVRINKNNSIKYDICPSYFKDIHFYKPNDAWDIIIIPACGINSVNVGKKSIIFTMWETDYLEPSWVKNINKAYMIIVPSQWAVDSFQSCGVTIPIHKIPLGYDPLIFHPSYHYPTECVFGTAAALTAGGLRKNTQHIVDLFQKTFSNGENAKLKIKITPTCPWQNCNDSRVEVLKTYLPPIEFANWYRSLTVFINGSYAEGWGLHLIEAAACACSIISTEYSAVTEYFDAKIGFVLDHTLVPASGGAYSGNWAKPSDDSIIKKMRYVYDNLNVAKEKGQQAFLRARNFTWKQTGNKLFKILIEQEIVKTS